MPPGGRWGWTNTSEGRIDITAYRTVRTANADLARALARTNLAVRCWLSRVKELPTNADDVVAKHRRVLAWLLANHLVQAYYRRCGIDVRPFEIGGMYGYGYAVGPYEPVCRRRDLGEMAWVACGSVRVDPRPAPGTPEPATPSYYLPEAIAAGEDPLWVIDRAAVVALGQRPVPDCRAEGCRHRMDAEVYLTVYQIITLLLATGYLHDAILGALADYHPLTGPSATLEHPLRRAGLVDKAGLAADWFELGPAYRTNRPFAWIHRSRGDLLLEQDGRLISYHEWCAASVDKGLEFMCRHIEA